MWKIAWVFVCQTLKSPESIESPESFQSLNRLIPFVWSPLHPLGPLNHCSLMNPRCEMRAFALHILLENISQALLKLRLRMQTFSKMQSFPQLIPWVWLTSPEFPWASWIRWIHLSTKWEMRICALHILLESSIAEPEPAHANVFLKMQAFSHLIPWVPWIPEVPWVRVSNAHLCHAHAG